MTRELGIVAMGVLALACERGGRGGPADGRAAHAASVAPDTLLSGMPPPSDRENLYAAAGAGMLGAVARAAVPRAYVPNGGAGTVSVIDLANYRVVRTFPTGLVPQHVVPAYDLKTLWVANEGGNTVTPIDPTTGAPGASVRVADPYNIYFTPDGRFAIVVAERQHRLDFRDPHTMALHDSLPVSCGGVDHMDFTADGRFAVATCEFSGQLLKLDVAAHRIVDLTADGVHLLDPAAFRVVGFIHTGRGAHGLYPSRDGRLLYVANRGWNAVVGGRHGPGSVSVLEFATRRVVATWPVPGGGSPDMGNVSADGKELWLSGRFDSEVYVFDTATGRLAHRIAVQRGPHGLTVWPQPGRYSLGHTGNMR